MHVNVVLQFQIGNTRQEMKRLRFSLPQSSFNRIHVNSMALHVSDGILEERGQRGYTQEKHMLAGLKMSA